MIWILQTNDFKKIELSGSAVTTPLRKEVTILSLKKLALFWGLSLFCVFIPVLHFLLTPLFFFLGILTFLKQHRNTHFIKEMTIPCPSCQQSLVLKNLYFLEDKKINCDHCANQLFFKTVQN